MTSHVDTRAAKEKFFTIFQKVTQLGLLEITRTQSMQTYEIVQEAKKKQRNKQYGNFDEEGKERVRRILSLPVSYGYFLELHRQRKDV